MLDSLVRVSRRAGGRSFRQRRGSRHLHLSRARRLGRAVVTRDARRGEAAGRGTSRPPPVPAAQLTLTRARATEAPGSLLAASASLPAISSPLHSLFKVLFIFPSRYLFAIGLSLMFSFRWNLPPTLSCTRKQLDSAGARGWTRAGWAGTGLSPSSASHSMEVVPARRAAASPL